MPFHKTMLDVSKPDIAPLLLTEDANKGYHTFRTPELIVRFYDLHEARQYKGKGAFGYDATFVADGMSAAVMESFIKEVRTQHLEQSVAAGACTEKDDEGDGGLVSIKGLITPDVEKDKVTETGLTRFKFKVPAEWPSGDSRQPLVYARDGALLFDPKTYDPSLDDGKGAPRCLGGAIVRVNFQCYTYIHKGKAGLRLEPWDIWMKQQGTGSSSDGEGGSGHAGFGDVADLGDTDDASAGEV